jgi:hypothetical protein
MDDIVAAERKRKDDSGPRHPTPFVRFPKEPPVRPRPARHESAEQLVPTTPEADGNERRLFAQSGECGAGVWVRGWMVECEEMYGVLS